MNSTAVLLEAFSRIGEVVHEAVDDLTTEQLARRLGGTANSIGWLVWHLTRVQDDHVAAVAGTEQLWTSAGWADRFGLSLAATATGYAHSSAEVDAVRVRDAELLTGYYDAVHAVTAGYVAGLADSDLDRVVDTRWDPPVTLGARLVSVLSDDLQHAGQAALLRGLLDS